MDVIWTWITNNVGISIVISALVGPLLVGGILDLWLRPKIEAKKNKIVLVNNLKLETISLVQTIVAGLTFIYEYDKFIRGDGAIKSRTRVLTLQLQNDYERLKELSVSISKLSPYFNFDKKFVRSTVSQLAEISGNVMRISDTVEEKKYELFNGVNKKTLDKHIKELETLLDELAARTS